MQPTKLFRKYLEDTIESLQKSYNDYKEKELTTKDENHSRVLNACAAQTLEALEEMKRTLVAYNTFCEEKPEFQILSFSYYEKLSSPLKIKYQKGDIITL